jgi:hypothetical protein
MRSKPVAVLAMAVLLASGAAAEESRDPSTEAFHSSVNAKPHERLEIRLDSGAGIRITTWDHDEVAVESEGSLRRCPDAELSVNRIAGGVRVATRYTKLSGWNHSCSLNLVIRVPQHFDVSLTSSGGSFEAQGLRGRIEGRTGGGAIHLTGVRGSVRLSTGGGEIEVTDSDLDGRLSTGGGHVSFENVTGDVVGSSGSMQHEVRGSTRSQ